MGSFHCLAMRPLLLGSNVAKDPSQGATGRAQGTVIVLHPLKNRQNPVGSLLLHQFCSRTVECFYVLIQSLLIHHCMSVVRVAGYSHHSFVRRLLGTSGITHQTLRFLYWSERSVPISGLLREDTRALMRILPGLPTALCSAA